MGAGRAAQGAGAWTCRARKSTSPKSGFTTTPARRPTRWATSVRCSLDDLMLGDDDRMLRTPECPASAARASSAPWRSRCAGAPGRRIMEINASGSGTARGVTRVPPIPGRVIRSTIDLGLADLRGAEDWPSKPISETETDPRGRGGRDEGRYRRSPRHGVAPDL